MLKIETQSLSGVSRSIKMITHTTLHSCPPSHCPELFHCFASAKKGKTWTTKGAWKSHNEGGDSFTAALRNDGGRNLNFLFLLSCCDRGLAAKLQSQQPLMDAMDAARLSSPLGHTRGCCSSSRPPDAPLFPALFLLYFCLFFYSVISLSIL